MLSTVVTAVRRRGVAAVTGAARRMMSSGPLPNAPASGMKVGVVGLGNMGAGIAQNLIDAGNEVVVYDVSNATRNAWDGKDSVSVELSPRDVAAQVDVVISVLPNDDVLKTVVIDPNNGIMAGMNDTSHDSLHVSVSTVSPDTSRAMARMHEKAGHSFVGAPIFARPDGVRARQGSFVLGGDRRAVSRATPILQTTCDVWDFGEDAGAGNVVKLCGNFLIAATIESMAEALALAENNGADRDAVKDMLTSTIFDCLIYKGYGQRVAERDHLPGGFALELGLKDVNLVRNVAAKTNVPMPFASALHDRFLQARAQGMSDFDWSAIGLLASEAAGVDVSKVKADTLAAVEEEKKSRK